MRPERLAHSCYRISSSTTRRSRSGCAGHDHYIGDKRAAIHRSDGCHLHWLIVDNEQRGIQRRQRLILDGIADCSGSASCSGFAKREQVLTDLSRVSGNGRPRRGLVGGGSLELRLGHPWRPVRFLRSCLVGSIRECEVTTIEGVGARPAGPSLWHCPEDARAACAALAARGTVTTETPLRVTSTRP
jgi:hypothetical protein